MHINSKVSLYPKLINNLKEGSNFMYCFEALDVLVSLMTIRENDSP